MNTAFDRDGGEDIILMWLFRFECFCNFLTFFLDDIYKTIFHRYCFGCDADFCYIMVRLSIKFDGCRMLP